MISGAVQPGLRLPCTLARDRSTLRQVKVTFSSARLRGVRSRGVMFRLLRAEHVACRDSRLLLILEVMSFRNTITDYRDNAIGFGRPPCLNPPARSPDPTESRSLGSKAMYDLGRSGA